MNDSMRHGSTTRGGGWRKTSRHGAARYGLALLPFLFVPACRSSIPNAPVLPGGSAEQTPPDFARNLAELIEHELADKDIPGISIALVDGDEVVWSAGFGEARDGVPATADTIHRVGSVSKLFTDIAVMQLVERGELDLDVPVETYLPGFQPESPFPGPITLRQLMCHRSGLVREPPVGHYFDASEPSLAATVASLNDTELVYEPETRVKYSNAAIAVVGYLLEVRSGRPFADYLKEAVLDPVGMSASAFQPTPEVQRSLADAEMWSFDGRSFPAPTFELGMSPAGSLYASANELALFMQMLFAGGEGAWQRVLEAETIESMYRPQFAAADAKRGFGIGFYVGELDGHRSCGHGGAVYGFATSLKILPDERLGVVTIANMDVVNSVTGRITDHALRSLLARRTGEKAPAPFRTGPLDPAKRTALEGHYRSGDRSFELRENDGELWFSGGRRWSRVRADDGGLVLDDRHEYGRRIGSLGDGGLRWGGADFVRSAAPRPDPAPERFLGLIGEYGWDFNVLFVYEREGQLHALIEWVEIDPLVELSDSTFAFPETGLYHGEEIHFVRDETGRATEAIVAGLRFPRRTLLGESDETFYIEKQYPIEALKRDALAASPPQESGEFRETHLVDLASFDSTIRFDIRYATTNNFMRSRFYDEPRAFMQREAAASVVRAHESLAERGYGLLVHDAYRPWYVTKMFWDATPAENKDFVADPSAGSRHNRGCAVDLTLYELDTGKPVEMLGQYDEFSERSYPEYQGGTSLQRWRRDLLREAMEAEGFRVYQYEWWHYDYQGWERFRIGNQVFNEIDTD